MDQLYALPIKEAREAFEREYMLKQCEIFGGNVAAMARFVGMERTALHRKLRALGIARTGFTLVRK